MQLHLRTKKPMRLLVSPVNIDEALVCAAAAEHIDVLDVKRPEEGSLGANYPWLIKAIRNATPSNKPVSASIGDAPFKPGTIAQAALGAVVSGADYIKVGLYGITTPEQGIELMRGVVRAVKDFRSDATVVATGYADAYRIGAVAPHAVPYIAHESGADGAMLDTAIKDGSGLFNHVCVEDCGRFVYQCHQYGLFACLAGSVKAHHVIDLARIGTDIIGVRGSVCSGGDRHQGTIQRELIVALRQVMNKAINEMQKTAVPV